MTYSVFSRPIPSRLIRVTAAAADNLPVSLDRAKAHLSVTHTEDDERITALILAAQDALQPPTGWLAGSVMKQTLRLDLAAWPCSNVRLPGGPVIEGGEDNSLAVSYFDAANEAQDVDDESYFIDGDALVFSNFSAPGLFARPYPIRITYDAGYETAAALPPTIALAILIMVRDYYDAPDGVGGSVPPSAQELLMPMKQRTFA